MLFLLSGFWFVFLALGLFGGMAVDRYSRRATSSKDCKVCGQKIGEGGFFFSIHIHTFTNGATEKLARHSMGDV
jgi:hypothetical protein